ncbi:hypothetical protein B0H13DRAFT_2232572 [Mycena leptocephala]|nr:hypothetical protein B0H13DRAFT_2232572 [Mycena leptocephala]
MPSAPRVWLITGASSGFGRALTEVILAQGEIAVATLRTPADLDDLVAANPNPERLCVVKCDITKADDIISAFSCAIERFGRVDVVFNNAGCAIVGEIEATPDDAARALFEVNFWGAVAVSKESVRVFRDVNPPGAGGRLLNVTSAAGFGGVPIVSLEGFTDSFRMEMDPSWSIKISIIAPGAFETRAQKSVIFPTPEAYSAEGLPSQIIREGWFKDGARVHGDPVLAVKAIFRFSLLESPPSRWAMGKDSVGGVRARTKRAIEETDEFESWSDNLELVG